MGDRRMYARLMGEARIAGWRVRLHAQSSTLTLLELRAPDDRFWSVSLIGDDNLDRAAEVLIPKLEVQRS